ncbi:MAG: C39 family peptidase [Candidatus Ozemobacteraceae bacterium]
MTSRIALPLLSFILICTLLLVGCYDTATPSYAGQGTADQIMLPGIPDVRQAEYFSCGASAFQAVLSYYGVDSFERDLRLMLNTSNTHGTYSWDMVRVAQQLGFSAEWKENCTLNDLESALQRGNPVIIRAERVRAQNSTWENTWTVGHYMVVIGLDKQNVYLEDPYLIGSRLYLTRDDFTASWHSYVSEVPIPANAPKHFHEAVFISGKPPAVHQEFIGPDVIPNRLPPVVTENP